MQGWIVDAGAALVSSALLAKRSIAKNKTKEIQALEQQLKAAKAALKQKPADDQFIKVQKLKGQVQEAKKATRYQLKVTRDTLIGAGIGAGSSRLIRYKVFSRSIKPTPIKPTPKLRTPLRKGQSPFDPKAFREMYTKSTEEWSKFLRQFSHDDILDLNDKALKTIGGVKKVPQSDANYFGETLNLYAGVIPPGLYPNATDKDAIYMFVADKAKGNRNTGLMYAVHEFLHVFQRKNAGSSLMDGSERRLTPELMEMALGKTNRKGQFLEYKKFIQKAPLDTAKGKLRWRPNDFAVEKLLATASPQELASLKTKYIKEVLAHRAGGQFATEAKLTMPKGDLDENIYVGKVYKRLVYLIGQEEQRRGLGAAREGFQMRVKSVSDRL